MRKSHKKAGVSFRFVSFRFVSFRFVSHRTNQVQDDPRRHDYNLDEWCEKHPFFEPLLHNSKTINLPRQAPDKHKENSKQVAFCVQGGQVYHRGCQPAGENTKEKRNASVRFFASIACVTQHNDLPRQARDNRFSLPFFFMI